MKGMRMGRVVRWNCKTRMNHVHCRTDKGNLQAWRHVLESDVSYQCRKCGRYADQGYMLPWSAYMERILGEGRGRGKRWMRGSNG